MTLFLGPFKPFKSYLFRFFLPPPHICVPSHTTDHYWPLLLQLFPTDLFDATSYLTLLPFPLWYFFPLFESASFSRKDCFFRLTKFSPLLDPSLINVWSIFTPNNLHPFSFLPSLHPLVNGPQVLPGNREGSPSGHFRKRVLCFFPSSLVFETIFSNESKGSEWVAGSNFSPFFLAYFFYDHRSLSSIATICKDPFRFQSVPYTLTNCFTFLPCFIFLYSYSHNRSFLSHSKSLCSYFIHNVHVKSW